MGLINKLEQNVFKIKGSSLLTSPRREWVMKNETDENLVFNSENCRAKARDTEELVDCLAIKQAGICRFSLLFGNGYFCTHPERSEIIAKTQNLNIRHDSESEGSTSSEG